MARNRKFGKQIVEVFAAPETTTRLPIDRPIAVYYRQSTLPQVGNVSTAIQTVDMVDNLRRQGWAEEKIILIDMDEGISGSKKIDERPGMRMLFEFLTEGKIGAIACQDEDRLFRDVTQIQVNIFIEACRAANVLVLTPSIIYDFANPLTGQFHARQFRFKSEMAAEYINTVIRGKLHPAIRRLRMEGRWVGAGMPPGFMVDMRKNLPDGSTNPQWRKFVAFPPYAEVVNEYFRLFLSYSGSLRATVRHIQENGPYYPNPTFCRPPDGFKAIYRMHKYDKGYCPGRTGLLELLTNPAYIGHWSVKDSIVRWHNHEPIVPLDLFEAAFNYLSPVALDGTPNPYHQPYQEHARPSTEAERGVPRPLCAGMLVSLAHGTWKNVGTYWVKPLKHYTYYFTTLDPIDEYGWSRKADFLDQATVALLREKLAATFEPGVWQETLADFNENYERERSRTVNQLKSLEKVMANILASLDILSNAAMIREAEARYEEHEAEHARLTQELMRGDDEQRRLEAIYSLRDTCGPALENWENLDRSEKRVVLHAFIRRIEATPDGEKALRLVVYWRDNSQEEITLSTQGSTFRFWLPEEEQRLFELLDNGAGQVKIAQGFPDRTWKMIYDKIFRERGSVPHFKIHPIRVKETYGDYLKRRDAKKASEQEKLLANSVPVTHPEKVRLDEQGLFHRAGAMSRLRLTLHG